MNATLNLPPLPEEKIGKYSHLFGLSLDQLKAWCRLEHLPEFRAIQLFQWIYRQGEHDFQNMSNIAKPLRERLSQALASDLPTFTREQRSKDGTIKWSMTLPRGGEIETVYIPEDNRGTLCISSQVGCCLGCKFCATGQQGFQRNLKPHEIIAQVWRAAQALRQWRTPPQPQSRAPITNIVFMGMGEPLLNPRAVFSVLKILLDPYGFGFSKRRVTVSTSGVVPNIYQLGRELDVALAISLHAPNDELRSQIMPINRKYPLSELLPALRWYVAQGNANAGGLTVEYTLLKGLNDQKIHARQLATLFDGLPIKVNLIPWNRIDGVDFLPSDPQTIHTFGEALKQQGIFFTQRKERGADIAAACGQLVGNVQTPF